MYKKTVHGIRGMVYEKTVWDSFEEIVAFLNEQGGFHGAEITGIENCPDKAGRIALKFYGTVYLLELFDVTAFFINIVPVVYHINEVRLEKTEKGVRAVVDEACIQFEAGHVELSA